ncbi:hypothetical protein AtDm6_0867 [Acetobacter tropicalis]|uniref:Uncharacterized protein n=1 Tax=Acetobacter tropicalis TaxID=104102 RepID=A0A094ZSQ3_9PROT|nr:hypothetical protein AtDm6_0867 [Acetobacter tropicalis]
MPWGHEHHQSCDSATFHCIQFLAKQMVVGSGLVVGHGVAGEIKQILARVTAIFQFSLCVLTDLPVQGR